MPYIPPTDRTAIENCDRAPDTAGELNFVISKMLDLWLVDNGVNYDNINACIGVLACAQHELYRRIAVPHESKKLAENGDVFSAQETPR